MSLITIIGGSNSNSYLTKNEANTYFKARLHSDLWSTFESIDVGLQTATRILDWNILYPGSIVSSSQALGWPRNNVVDINGFYVPNNIIPVEIKNATCELLYFMIEEDPTTPDDMEGIKKLKIGPLEIVAKDFNTGKIVIPNSVLMALNGMGTIKSSMDSGFSSSQLRVVRT